MDATPPVKRLRKANWGDDETLCLVQMYQEKAEQLRGSFNKQGISNQKKHQIWGDMAQNLNTNFENNRTSSEVKKRWFAISSRSRQNIQRFREAQRRTGEFIFSFSCKWFFESIIHKTD